MMDDIKGPSPAAEIYLVMAIGRSLPDDERHAYDRASEIVYQKIAAGGWPHFSPAEVASALEICAARGLADDAGDIELVLAALYNLCERVMESEELAGAYYTECRELVLAIGDRWRQLGIGETE